MPDDDEERETDMYICESVAYHRLAEAGFCDRGIIPKFYGSMDEIDPKHMGHHLAHFNMNGKLKLPSAILMEFIPDLRILDIETFTTDRGSRIRTIMTDMHEAGVLHHDIEPRHFLVQESSDRVVVIDFDRAQTFPPTTMSARWERAFNREQLLIQELLDLLVGFSFLAPHARTQKG